jgi:hypothetical protein
VLLSQLTTLSLMSNVIERVSHEALAPLTSLRHLDLANNRLRRIDDAPFRHQSSLRLLQLSGNPLVHLDRSSLAGLHSLTSLRLSYVSTPLANFTLSTDFLTDVRPTLARLEFDNSPGLAQFFARLGADKPTSASDTEAGWAVSSFSPPPSLGFKHLRRFSAVSSDLVHLGPDFALRFDPSASVHLTSARWHCDRDVAWFRDWLRESKSLISDSSGGEPTSGNRRLSRDADGIGDTDDGRYGDGGHSDDSDATSERMRSPHSSSFQLVLVAFFATPSASHLPHGDVVFRRFIPSLKEVDDADNRCATPDALTDRTVASLADSELESGRRAASGLTYAVIRLSNAATEETLSMSRRYDSVTNGDAFRVSDDQPTTMKWDSVFHVADAVEDIRAYGSSVGGEQSRLTSRKPAEVDQREDYPNRASTAADLRPTVTADFDDKDKEGNKYIAKEDMANVDERLDDVTATTAASVRRLTDVVHEEVSSFGGTSESTNDSYLLSKTSNDGSSLLFDEVLIATDYVDDVKGNVLISASTVQRSRDRQSMAIVSGILAVTIVTAVAMVAVIVHLVREKKLVADGSGTADDDVIACRQKDEGVLYYSRRSPSNVDDVRAALPDVGDGSMTSFVGSHQLRVYKWEDF